MGLTRIAVGVDGTSQSRRVLEWAAAEASKWDADLLVVHACTIVTSRTDAFADAAKQRIGRVAQRLLNLEVDQARQLGARAVGLLVFGPPDEALIDASADADLLVVGDRRRCGLAATFLGSVSRACVYRAHCPVVVVHDEHGAGGSFRPTHHLGNGVAFMAPNG